MGDGSAPEGPRAPTCRMVRNEAALITGVDDAIIDVLGWLPEQLLGTPSTALIHPDDQASAVSAWFAMVQAPESTRTWRGRYRTGDGAWRWIEAINTNRLDDPDEPGVFTVLRPAAEGQLSLEEELRAREQLFARLADALPVGIFHLDRDGRVVFTNGRLHRILGSPPANDVASQFSVVLDDDRLRLDAAIESVLRGQEVSDLELRFHVVVPHPDFSVTRVCQVSLRPLNDGGGLVTGAIGCLSDVTESVDLRRELELRASTDGLTACLNRTATFELLDRALRAQTSQSGVAVIFVDLDRFKEVNDLLGHAAGDRAILVAADTIRGAVGTNDVVGRLGGDEFLVVCPGLSAPESAMPLARRISESLRRADIAPPSPMQLGASIGVAWTNDPAESADALIARADAAMYESKVNRTDRVILAHGSLERSSLGSSA
jgi:diguanylate cyclase (GGDEF)-like protein/PAS domain S-box-containing protein